VLHRALISTIIRGLIELEKKRRVVLIIQLYY
jgi:hypothetical protein